MGACGRTDPGGRWYRALTREVLEEDPVWGVLGGGEGGVSAGHFDCVGLRCALGGRACWVRGPAQRKAGDSSQGGEAPFKAF